MILNFSKIGINKAFTRRHDLDLALRYGYILCIKYLNMATVNPAMTLEPYTAQQLDDLALRALDLTSMLRKMAQTMRTEEVASFVVHDRKALEWMVKLDEWCQKTEAGLEVAVRRNRGARRAATFARPSAKSD